MRADLQELCDKAYCINLDTEPDRWDKVSAEFNKYNILDLIHRFPGETKYERREANNASVHLDIIREAKQDKLKRILIFEDDVEFLTKVWVSKEKRFIESDPGVYLRKAISQLKAIKWDILYLGWRLPLKIIPTRRNPELNCYFNSFINYKQISNNLFQSTCQYTTHAYIVNHTIYDKILENNPLEECIKTSKFAIDHFYGFWLSYNAVCININPIIATQRTGYSITKKSHIDNNRWTEQMLKYFCNREAIVC